MTQPPRPNATSALYGIASALRGALITPSVEDANGEPANLADTTYEIAKALFFVGRMIEKQAVAADRQADAVGVLVGLLSDRTPSKLKIAK